jgi:hypothetical protein
MIRSRPLFFEAFLALAVLAILALSAGVLSSCGGETGAEAQPPASVEESADGGPARLTLTDEAATRTGIETVAVQAAGQQLTIPYSAILYDADGKTWTYTNPEPLVFVRAPITVEQIQGDTATLSSGPPAGTLVVTVGAEELLGTEVGVGHE